MANRPRSRAVAGVVRRLRDRLDRLCRGRSRHDRGGVHRRPRLPIHRPPLSEDAGMTARATAVRRQHSLNACGGNRLSAAAVMPDCRVMRMKSWP
ncbi:hypothetical protein BOSEA31B_13239 [Hyphomicrobiales bacterium]|nr:hypothetical protein BOSEA31B_13239 [Hyphomicrobiales bacterium]CAH1699013.1 hypothetical protein BOSEA1005_12066 [Hyphomicrobiales bacterium]